MTKLSLSFFPNDLKRALKNAKTPVYMRLILNRKKTDCRLDIDLDERELQLWDTITMRVRLRDSDKNLYLDAINQSFEKFKALNALTLHRMDIKEIQDKILNRESATDGKGAIISFVDNYYDKCVKDRKNLSKGTKINYLKAIKHLKCYMKHYKCEKYTFKDFTFAFANNFKNYLLNDIPEINKKGVSEVYALGLVKKFKTIFHQAVEEEIITKNFFKSLKLSSKSPRKPRLNIEQLRAIKSLETNLSIREELCRDLIVFQSLVGLAYKDTLTLSKTCIERRSNGETKLDTSRIKTNEFVQQFLPSQAVEIIDKYINLPHASSSDYIFPPIDNSDYNKILKLIALKAGIHFKLQTHTGRHSYRQLLPEAGIEDSAIINRMMGKKNKDQVDETYYEVTESRLLEAKRKFELYLTKNLNHDKA